MYNIDVWCISVNVFVIIPILLLVIFILGVQDTVQTPDDDDPGYHGNATWNLPEPDTG